MELTLDISEEGGKSSVETPIVSDHIGTSGSTLPKESSLLTASLGSEVEVRLVRETGEASPSLKDTQVLQNSGQDSDSLFHS